MIKARLRTSQGSRVNGNRPEEAQIKITEPAKNKSQAWNKHGRTQTRQVYSMLSRYHKTQMNTPIHRGPIS